MKKLLCLLYSGQKIQPQRIIQIALCTKITMKSCASKFSKLQNAKASKTHRSPVYRVSDGLGGDCSSPSPLCDFPCL